MSGSVEFPNNHKKSMFDRSFILVAREKNPGQDKSVVWKIFTDTFRMQQLDNGSGKQ